MISLVMPVLVVLRKLAAALAAVCLWMTYSPSLAIFLVVTSVSVALVASEEAVVVAAM